MVRTATESQYHHYIPRFILRNFAINLPKEPSKNPQARKNAANNAVVNVVSLKQNPPRISKARIRKLFGQYDMYKDDTKFTPKDQHALEHKLNELESPASRIIARVVREHGSGNAHISLSRRDRDLLRKFLFVMKYRSPIFFQRFNHQKPEDYGAADEKTFRQYMRDKGFKRPLDVWFDNLVKIIDAPIDPGGSWTWNLASQIYPPDALWLTIHLTCLYPVFVTAVGPTDEFLLTENSFGIHEGPVDYSTDDILGKQKMKAYSEFHVLCVLTPHLALVLRHNSLPEANEGQTEKTRHEKERALHEDAQLFNEPENVRSMLQDLPVTKARSSQDQLLDGWFQSAGSHASDSDEFIFPFFHLETHHIQTINIIMLDQAHHIDKLVFRSEQALRRALEFYLSYPTQTNGIYSMKTVSENPGDKNLLLLRKLEKLAQSLGSDVKARYHIEQPTMKSRDWTWHNDIVEVLKTARSLLPHLSSPLTLAMTIMSQVLRKVDITVPVAYAIYVITAEDGCPTYPEMIYAVVQSARETDLNTEYADGLINLSLDSWRMGWEVLVDKERQMPGADLEKSVETMRQYMKQFGFERGIGKHPEKLHAALERMQCHSGEIPPDSHLPVNSVKSVQSSGLSKAGLRRAFEELGDSSKAQISTKSPLSHVRDCSTADGRDPKSSDQINPTKQEDRARVQPNHRNIKASVIP